MAIRTSRISYSEDSKATKSDIFNKTLPSKNSLKIDDKIVRMKDKISKAIEDRRPKAEFDDIKDKRLESALNGMLNDCVASIVDNILDEIRNLSSKAKSAIDKVLSGLDGSRSISFCGVNKTLGTHDLGAITVAIVGLGIYIAKTVKDSNREEVAQILNDIPVVGTIRDQSLAIALTSAASNGYTSGIPLILSTMPPESIKTFVPHLPVTLLSTLSSSDSYIDLKAIESAIKIFDTVHPKWHHNLVISGFEFYNLDIDTRNNIEAMLPAPQSPSVASVDTTTTTGTNTNTNKDSVLMCNTGGLSSIQITRALSEASLSSI